MAVRIHDWVIIRGRRLAVRQSAGRDDGVTVWARVEPESRQGWYLRIGSWLEVNCQGQRVRLNFQEIHWTEWLVFAGETLLQPGTYDIVGLYPGEEEESLEGVERLLEWFS